MGRAIRTVSTGMVLVAAAACGHAEKPEQRGFDAAPDACALVSADTVDSLVDVGARALPTTHDRDSDCGWQSDATKSHRSRALIVQVDHYYVHPTDSAFALGRVNVENRYGRSPQYERVEMPGPLTYRDTEAPGNIHTHVDNVLISVMYTSGEVRGAPPTYVPRPAPELDETALRVTREAVQALSGA